MKLKHGFTLTELLIVIGIIAVVAAIVLPVSVSARRKSQATACINNMHQLAIAIQMYCSDHDDRFPDDETWRHWNSFSKSKVPSCPSATMPANMQYLEIVGVPGYNINNALMTDFDPPHDTNGLSKVSYPSATVMFCEQAVNENGGFSVVANGCQVVRSCSGITGERGFLRHFGGAHYAFVDGHVKWYRPEEVYDNQGGNINALPFNGSYPSFQVQ